jgi:hypothetical protein
MACSEMPRIKKYFDLCFGMRPAEELFDVYREPGQIDNLAARPEFGGLIESMRKDLDAHLRSTGDPRALGRGELFENAAYYASHGIESEGLPWREFLRKRGAAR